MYYSITLISIFEVLLEIVPMLLVIAYITVAERKTMASMQRRLGPNAVGYYGLLQALKSNKLKRNYHTSCLLNNTNDIEDSIQVINNSDKQAIRELYKGRIASVQVFSEKLLASCNNILDLEERAKFLQNLGTTGGIYIFQYKYDPLVYYIGRTGSFKWLDPPFKHHIFHKKHIG